MREELKKSTLVLSVSVALVVVGFSVQWAVGGKTAQSLGGSLILVGLLLLSYSLYNILKK